MILRLMRNGKYPLCFTRLNQESKVMNDTNEIKKDNLEKRDWHTPVLRSRNLQDTCLGGANTKGSESATPGGISYKVS